MSHYFETPATPARTRTVGVTLAGRRLELLTAGGVFSGDGLDLGTSVLLRTCDPAPGPVRVLDLGCGWGPITVSVALANPQARVTAVDVNDLAVELTRANVATIGAASRVDVLRPDDVDPRARFDEIWSNPPIRIGKPALHDLLVTWLGRLTPTGVAKLVVSKNLGADSLATWLGTQGWTVERIASAKGFRVLLVGM